MILIVDRGARAARAKSILISQQEKIGSIEKLQLS